MTAEFTPQEAGGRVHSHTGFQDKVGWDPSTFPGDERAGGWRDVDSTAEEIRAVGRGEAWQNRVREFVPLGQAGTGKDIAATVGFLCSDQAAWITGQTYLVDGGSCQQCAPALIEQQALSEKIGCAGPNHETAQRR